MADGSSIELATGYISLAVSTKNLGKQVATQFNGIQNQAQQSGKKAGARFGSAFGGGIKGLAGTAIALVGVAKTVGFLKDSIGEAREAQKVGAQTTQVIKTTGGAARISAKQIGTLATAISNKTGIDDEAIQSGENLLLTFTNIRNEVGKGNDIFNQATQTVTDMSAALGQSTKSSAIQLGKALNDPIKGITALQRVGVSFTAQQKDQIKTLVDSGDKLGAQKVILHELNKEFGGSAAASATAGDKMKVAFGNLKEQLGTALLPSLDKFSTLVTTQLIPGLSKGVDFFQKDMLPALGQIGDGFGTLKTLTSAWLDPFLKSLTGGKSVFKSFADFMGTHQTEITGGLIAGAGFAIDFASALGTLASVGLKAFAFLTDAQADLTAVMLVGFKSMLNAAAISFGWVPGLGDKLAEANSKFDGFATGLVSGMHDSADGARKLADGIDTKMTPALAAARKGLDKAADQQKLQAASRDTAYSIGLIGTTAQGNQIHLKKFSDISKLSADQQAALRGRLGDSQKALRDQLGSMKAAGSGQAALTKAWKTGKDRLYDEFRQMGLSKTEAGKLATKYAGIKPKVETKITQPGMKGKGGAIDNAKDLKDKYKDIPGSITTKINFDTQVDKINTKLVYQGGKGARLIGFDSGGYTGNLDPRKVAGAVHGDEHVIRSSSRRKIEKKHPGWLDEMNKTGRIPGYQDGGRVLQLVVKDGAHEVLGDGTKAIGKDLKRLSSSLAGGLAPGVGAANGHGLVRVGSHGYWTRLFAANIHRAEASVGRKFIVYQAGFNHGRVAASGSTHDGDAIDARQDMGLRNAFRHYVGAMWFRNWTGNYHMHGVPAPGRGFGSASARAQYRDYLRGGDGLGGGYAAGTRSASPGWHPVNENGQREYIKFKGSEQVRTQQQMSAAGGSVINFNGPVTGTDVEHLARELEKKRRRAEALQPV